MAKINLALALIDYNGGQHFRETLDSISKQDACNDVELSVVVVRCQSSVSEQEIANVLKDCTNKVTVINIDPNPEKAIALCDALSNISACLGDDVEWIWTLEEGNRLASRDTIRKVAATIRESAPSNVHMIHACSADRSFNTGYVHQGKVQDLCNRFGYFEIFGKPAFSIVRSQHFKFAYNHQLSETASAAKTGDIWVTEHTHSQFLFLALALSEVVSIDLKLVDTDEWTSSPIVIGPDDWFKITREIIELAEAAGENTLWSPHFFRYGTLSLWNQLIHQQAICSERLNPSMMATSIEYLHFIDQWNIILRLADYVDDKELTNIIVDVVTNGIRLTLEYLQDDTKDKTALNSFFEEQNQDMGIYPTTMMRPDYLMQCLQKSA